MSKDILTSFLIFGLFFIFTKILNPLGDIFLAATIPAIYFTKKDYIWLAVFYMLYSYPGALFNAETLSLMQLGGLGVIHFYFLFIVIVLFKLRNIKASLFINKFIIIIFLYTSILIVAYGIQSFTALIKVIMAWLMIYVTPKVLANEEKMDKFFMIIIYFSFFVLATNIYEVVFHQPIAVLFGGYRQSVFMNIEGQVYSRPVFGIWISLLAAIGSFRGLLKSSNTMTNTFFIAVIAINTFSILLSATRGWILSIFLLIGFYTLITAKVNMSKLLWYIPIIVAVVFILIEIPAINMQLDASISRLMLSKDVISGDLSVEATGGRYQAGIKVIEEFSKNPIFGIGLGKDSFYLSNIHTGNQTMLLRYGIVGYLIYLSFWITYVNKLRFKAFDHRLPTKMGSILKMDIFLFVIIFIIHSSSGQRLDFYSYYIDILWVALIFGIGCQDYNIARKYLILK